MRKNIKLLVFIILSLIIIETCAVNPVTGKKEIMLISKKDEIILGKNLNESLKSEIGFYNSLNLNAYVRRIGNKIVPYTHRPDLKYHFNVLDTPTINAFAAPGGYIYVTRGLLAIVSNEAELAVILGHELGHVNARHSAKAMTKQILFALGLAIGSELSEKIRKFAPLASIATQLLFLKYSRNNEYQADSLGVKYARACGYNPALMIGFFKSLSRMSKEAGNSHIPNFLSTHPLTKRRIEEVKKMIKPEDRNGLIKQNAYLYKIDNLVYGLNPLNGYKKNGYFYHPLMRFKFKIPFGWKVKNTPARVTLVSNDGKAAIVLMAEKNSLNLESYSNKKIQKLSSYKIQNRNQHYINGLNALSKSLIIKGSEENGSEVSANMTFVRKGNMIYTIMSLASRNDFYNYKRQFNSMVFSFSHLRNSAYINVRPVRLRIARAERGQYLKNFLIHKRVRKKLFKAIARINSLRLNSYINRGRLIKLLY